MTDLCECTDCPDLGRCCWFWVVLPWGRTVYSRIHCPFLGDNGQCTVYEKRMETAPWCGSIGNKSVRWPTFCPHVDETKAARPYVGASEAEMKKVDAMVIEAVEKNYGVKLNERSELV